jgi:AcrR family transcriptional regulator
MRQIAGQARVSLAMLPHYFGSKNDLYEACIDAVAGELKGLRETLVLAFSGVRDLRQAIEIAVRHSYSFARGHRSAVQLLMRTVLDTGELDPAHREHVLLSFLDQGAALLAPLLGRPVDATRLALLSINYLIIRFALNSSEEAARITRRVGASAEEVDAVVADYLVAAARALLGADDGSGGAGSRSPG